MTKKITLVLLSLLLILMPAFSMGVREINDDENIVKLLAVEYTDDGACRLYCLKTDGNDVYYYITDETTVEYPVDILAAGDVLVVKDNGISTMSIPPQMYATDIRNITMAVSLGLYDVSFPEMNAKPGAQAAVPASEATVLAESPFTADELAITEMVPRFGYSYGYLSMDSLMNQGLIVKGNYFARGLMDAIDITQSTLLTYDEMLAAAQEYMDTVYNQGIVGSYGDVVTDLEALADLPKPEALDDRFSYAYGYMVTIQLMSQGIELDRLAFPAGMLTRLYAFEPLLTTTEMEEAFNTYVEYLNDLVEQWLEQMAADNLAAAESFLAENAAKEGVVSISDKLQMVYTAGDAELGAAPAESDTVTVNYTLTDSNGTVLDQGEGISFPLDGVIPGFKTAILNMKVGQSATAYIHPDLGYGVNGAGNIEPNKLLIFDIDLIGIEQTEE